MKAVPDGMVRERDGKLVGAEEMVVEACLGRKFGLLAWRLRGGRPRKRAFVVDVLSSTARREGVNFMFEGRLNAEAVMQRWKE